MSSPMWTIYKGSDLLHESRLRCKIKDVRVSNSGSAWGNDIAKDTSVEIAIPHLSPHVSLGKRDIWR